MTCPQNLAPPPPPLTQWTHSWRPQENHHLHYRLVNQEYHPLEQKREKERVKFFSREVKKKVWRSSVVLESGMQGFGVMRGWKQSIGTAKGKQGGKGNEGRLKGEVVEGVMMMGPMCLLVRLALSPPQPSIFLDMIHISLRIWFSLLKQCREKIINCFGEKKIGTEYQHQQMQFGSWNSN